mgnify:CR=1 FL=1
MREIRTETQIDAPPEEVWRVLTGFAEYGEWNPYIPWLEGNLAVGERLRVRLALPGGSEMTIRPSVIRSDAPSEFRWLGHLLFPGLFVRVRVLALEAEDALLVDERAIGTDLGGKYRYLVGENDIVERVYVTVGQPQPDGTIVVEEGLDPDATYISNGLLRARPGLPVTPMTEEEVAQRQAGIESQMQAPGGEDDDSGEEE